jgi:hypothetical protein
VKKAGKDPSAPLTLHLGFYSHSGSTLRVKVFSQNKLTKQQSKTFPINDEQHPVVIPLTDRDIEDKKRRDAYWAKLYDEQFGFKNKVNKVL